MTFGFLLGVAVGAAAVMLRLLIEARRREYALLPNVDPEPEWFYAYQFPDATGTGVPPINVRYN